MFPLPALTDVRVITVGSLAVCWLSFERGSVGARAPRLLVVPAEAYRRARPVFERAIESPTQAGRTAPLAERVILFVFGIGLLALEPVFRALTVRNSEARLTVTYLGAMMGISGLLFLRFAAVS
ncbi:hypothetical protein BRC86_11680 [Halobacteriales archaeon QS_3_64_16]|nr:MAG: hypothetical protein BRC86_11680 [Halobacteriales archaeon QS_3_64_16]